MGIFDNSDENQNEDNQIEKLMIKTMKIWMNENEDAEW